MGTMPLRIGVLTTGYPRFEGDVAGSFVDAMVRGLRRRGHEVDVLAPADRAGEPPPGVHWVRYGWPPSTQRTFYGAGVPDNVRDPRSWPGLATFPIALRRHALQRSAAWDAVISHFGLPCGWVGASLRKARHLVVWHSADVFVARHLPRAIRRPLLRQGVHWFVLDEHRRSLAEPETDAVVCPMGAEVRHVNRASARRELGLTRHTVLVLGRLVPIKAVDRVIDALAGTETTLLVAGDGPERPALERRARRRRIDARFLGWVREPLKSALLHAADVLAQTSRPLPSGRREGAPVVVMEARAAGLPVVSDPAALCRPRPRIRAPYVSSDDVAELAESILYGRTRRVPGGGV